MLVLVFLIFIGLAASEFEHKVHEKFKTLPKHDFVSYFNSLNHSWTIAHYGEDMHLKFGVKLNANDNIPKIKHGVMDLPENFDSREQWPHCETIKEINNQGDCHSCYLFSTINSASDRTCIHTDVHVHLAEQEGDCIYSSDVCDGGDPFRVLNFWVENGLVSEECKPYNISAFSERKCKKKCTISSKKYSHDKHYGEKAYRVDSDIDSIRAEIVKNGPVVVSMVVYEDFVEYGKGVYEHKYGDFKGMHAIRLIGFGVDEKGVEYWLLANSWGTIWGESGYVRVKVGQLELEIENRVTAGLPRRN